MEHEPRGFLRDSECPMQLPRRDSVLVVYDHPDSRQPLLKWNRRVLKDRADLRRELPLGMYALALPATLVSKNFASVRPQVGHVTTPFGKVSGIMYARQLSGSVKYWIASCKVLGSLDLLSFMYRSVFHLTNQVKRNLISEVYLYHWRNRSPTGLSRAFSRRYQDYGPAPCAEKRVLIAENL